jgi:hypothetical protein
MEEFLLLYRADNQTYPGSSPEEMQAISQKWMNWIASKAIRHYEKAIGLTESRIEKQILSKEIKRLSGKETSTL